MSTDDIAARPGPAHITLLFKHAKSTTVLSLLPSQTLSEAKMLLLQVLQSRDVATFPGTSTLLPKSPSDLELAVTRDHRDGRDPSRGWTDVESASSLIDSAKSGKRKSSVGKERTSETIGDLNLRDGAYIAYRLRRKVEDLVDDDMNDKVDDPAADNGWNVTIPSFEDEDDIGAPRRATAEADEGEDEDMDMPIPVPRNTVAR